MENYPYIQINNFHNNILDKEPTSTFLKYNYNSSVSIKRQKVPKEYEPKMKIVKNPARRLVLDYPTKEKQNSLGTMKNSNTISSLSLSRLQKEIKMIEINLRSDILKNKIKRFYNINNESAKILTKSSNIKDSRKNSINNNVIYQKVNLYNKNLMIT